MEIKKNITKEEIRKQLKDLYANIKASETLKSMGMLSPSNEAKTQKLIKIKNDLEQKYFLMRRTKLENEPEIILGDKDLAYVKDKDKDKDKDKIEFLKKEGTIQCNKKKEIDKCCLCNRDLSLLEYKKIKYGKHWHNDKILSLYCNMCLDCWNDMISIN